MLYFAYGSNMDWKQMKRRCPSARFQGIAKLPDHRLAFTRYSSKLGCNVADAVRDTESVVWGAIYQISASDLGALDKAEGYRPGRKTGNAYERRKCLVIPARIAAGAEEVEAYFANPDGTISRPNDLYKGLIVAGARRWHLPDRYIRQLMAIKTVEG